jgi:plasmid stabilization system protein ParE
LATEIRYLTSALEDLREIFQYIHTDNPPAAKKLMKDFDASIGNLSLFPESGVMPKDNVLKGMNYRLLLIGNYIIFLRL